MENQQVFVSICTLVCLRGVQALSSHLNSVALWLVVAACHTSSFADWTPHGPCVVLINVVYIFFSFAQ